jgi:hypothetical protein
MNIYREFGNLKAALDYRLSNGYGGWFFEDAKTGHAILFPVDILPTHIFTHPISTGKSGRLIGHA